MLVDWMIEMSIKLITAITLFACLLLLPVIGIGFIVEAYAPLWLQIASIPVIAWLIVVVIVKITYGGFFDRWDTEPEPSLHNHKPSNRPYATCDECAKDYPEGI
jgi:hypothetical protein